MRKLKLPALQLSILLSLCMQAEAKSYRDPAVRQAFTEQNPCPIVDEKTGKCLAEVDHKEALCAGGKDEVENLQYLSKEQHRLKTLMDIKRCAIIRRENKEAK